MTAEGFETSPGGDDPLDALRGQIDAIDAQIMALVVNRTSLTRAIAEEKAARGIPTMVGTRHTEVIENYMSAAEENG